MTVAELIEELKKQDPSADIEAECASCGYSTDPEEIEPKGRAFPHTLILKEKS